MLDVRRMSLLRELARRGTIAEVARVLSYSPSAVSQQLTVLEREAGTALLARSGRSVTLTPAARELVTHTDAVLERLGRAESDLVRARGEITGTLRIGTYPTAGGSVLPRALAALLDAHPGLEPAVHETDPADVAGALRVDDLDVALTHVYDLVPEAPDPGLGTEHLYDEAMYLAFPRNRTPDSSVDSTDRPLLGWRHAPWITATPATSCGAMTLRACRAAGFEPRVRHVVDDFGTVLGLVGIRQGVALVPEPVAGQAPDGVALEKLTMRRSTVAAYRAGTQSHPGVRAFVNAVRTVAAPV